MRGRTMPPVPLAKHFSEIADSILWTMKAKDDQSQALVAIRNTLLRKLRSGEPRMKGVERFLMEITG